MNRQKILIVDDSELNREMLKAILGEEYDYAEAEDGAQAILMLQQDMNIDLLLLDINMPKIDGFGVLERLNQFRWIEELPVIMISATEDRAVIERCYSLGITDYIRRPFDSFIVQRRVKNTLTLYANQKRLMGMVSDQIYQNEKDSHVMIGILSHIVEFRNSESAQHVLQVQTVTEMLLRKLTEKTDVYGLTEEKIRLITTASALHDIGKISIPENILNKAGALTPEEFNIIRTHPAIGASMLEGLTQYRDEPLVKVAIEICRWHHERWDGGGYPDGLLGEQIPISAQVVALADVFDALTSDRCYKKAYTHDTAITMILNGECGAFNPMLLDCLQEISMRLRSALPTLAADQVLRRDAKRLSAELLQKSAVPHSDRAQRELNYVKEKLDFFVSCCGDVQFEYDVPAGTIIIADRSRPRQQQCTILDVHETDSLRLLRPADIARLRAALKATTPENNELSLSLLLPVGRKQHWHNIRMHTLWSPFSPGHYVGVIGCLTDAQKVQGGCVPFRCTGKSATDEPSIIDDIQRLSAIFDVVRLVDPTKYAVLDLDADGILHRTGERCAAFWDNDAGCANCISARAFAEHTTLNKLEFTRNEMYFVIAKYITINGTPCVLELVSRLNEGRWIDANGSRFLLDRTRGEDMQLFLDPLTNVYSRRYFETYRPHLEGMEGVALIDVNNFKLINDRCGHAAGDAALLDVAQQLILQAGGQDHPAGLALAADDGHAPAGSLGGDGGQLADADTGGTDRLQHQRQTGAACLPGGADKGGVLLRGDLPLLRRVGLVLDAQTAHTAVLPVEQAQKAVQRGQDGVDTVGGVVLCQVGLVVQHSVVGQGRVTQPLGEAADVAPVALQCGGGFFLVPQSGEEVVELCGGNGHGGASLYIK